MKQRCCDTVHESYIYLKIINTYIYYTDSCYLFSAAQIITSHHHLQSYQVGFTIAATKWPQMALSRIN